MSTSPQRSDEFVANRKWGLMFQIRHLIIGLDLSQLRPADVYEVVSGRRGRGWAFNPGSWADDPSDCLVLARLDDRIIGAYWVLAWIRNRDEPGRWRFVGEPADMETQLRYVGCGVPRQYRGAVNPVQFFGSDEDR